MKNTLIMLLVFSLSCNAVAAPLMCHELFTTLSSEQINPKMPSESLKTKLEEFDVLYFNKSGGIFSKVWRRIKGESADPERFDLKLFNQKIDFYLNLLADAKASNETIDSAKLKEVTPKNLEEALALMEAKNQLTPDAAGVDVVRKWLATSSAGNIKKMRELLKLDNDARPAALYSKVAKLYLLAHAPRENLDYILNTTLSEKAVGLIARRAMLSFLTNTYSGALDELGITKATGAKAWVRQKIEDYPNATNFGFNVALGALEVHFLAIGIPVFATVRELNLLKRPIEKITDAQRLQIIQGDFRGLPSKLQTKLMRFAQSEVVWRRFLQIVGIAGLAWMLYYIQDQFRHHYSTTISKSDREKLLDDAIKVYIATQEYTYEKTPSSEELANERASFAKQGDGEIEKYVHGGSFYIALAKKYKNDKSKARGL